MPKKQSSMEPQPAPTASLLFNEVAAHQNENEDSDISTLNETTKKKMTTKNSRRSQQQLEPRWYPTCKPSVLHNAIQDLKHELLTEFTHRENRIVHYLGSKLTAFEHAQLLALPTTSALLSTTTAASCAASNSKKRKHNSSTTTIPRDSTSGETKKSKTTTKITRKNHHVNDDGVQDEGRNKHIDDNEITNTENPMEEETNNNSSTRSPAGHPYPVFVKEEHAHAESYRRWKLIYTDVAEYIANHQGRYPRLDYHDPSNSNTKVKLHQWMKNQKRFYSKALLPAHHPQRCAFSQRRLQDLEALPYWRWPKKKKPQHPHHQHQAEVPTTNNTDTTTNASSLHNEENDQSISAQRIDV